MSGEKGKRFRPAYFFTEEKTRGKKTQKGGGGKDTILAA